MDTVEAIVEVRSGVLTVVVVGAKAVSDVMSRCYSAVAVVDIDEDIVWYCDVPLFSSFDGCGHGIVHPNVGDDDHKREADGPGVVGCVVTVVENEICCLKAQGEEFGDIRWVEVSAVFE